MCSNRPKWSIFKFAGNSIHFSIHLWSFELSILSLSNFQKSQLTLFTSHLRYNFLITLEFDIWKQAGIVFNCLFLLPTRHFNPAEYFTVFICSYGIMSLYFNIENNHMLSCSDHKITRIFIKILCASSEKYAHYDAGCCWMRNFMGFVVCLVIAGRNQRYYVIIIHFKLMFHDHISHVVI